eukprot:1073234-Alexandrium_andersonii.AAC.1
MQPPDLRCAINSRAPLEARSASKCQGARRRAGAPVRARAGASRDPRAAIHDRQFCSSSGRRDPPAAIFVRQ